MRNSPATRVKLLAIVADAQKKDFMDLELATTVDWRQSFVKATYLLEGDRPLVVECFEIIQPIQAAIQAAHTPNVAAAVQRLTGNGGSYSSSFSMAGHVFNQTYKLF